MTASKLLDRSNLTFSQAEGLAPLPSQLRLGEISTELRSVLWAYLVDELRRTRSGGRGMGAREQVGAPWYGILRDAHRFLYHFPADEFDPVLTKVMDTYKRLMWEGAYNQIFDFLQFAMRHSKHLHSLAEDIDRILRRCRAAYTIIDEGPTIVPIGSESEVRALVQAFKTTVSEGFPGAGKHLRLAVEALNGERFGDSVRESVHAVESAARVLSEDAKVTLAPAIHQLETKLGMHPAFKKALVALYGYTSDEAGIRHSLLEDEARVDMHDALFMLGACASFVTFLIGKGRAAGLLSE